MWNLSGHDRDWNRLATWVVAAVLSVSVAVPLARAQDSLVVTGVLDYEPVPPSVIVESVNLNLVTLEFSIEGGPFSGSATLELLHDVPSQGCRFQSNHEWVFSGDFDPATLQFSGTYVELVETTVGDCPDNFSFTRTFDPDEADFKARLNLQTGEIVSQIPPLAFTLMVDPALVESLAAEPAPPVTSRSTTDPGGTAQTTTTGVEEAPLTPTPISPTAQEETTTGFPWLPLALLALALLALGTWWWLRRRTADRPAEDEEDKEDCSELERRYRAAKKRCDEAGRRVDDASNRLDDATERLKRRQLEFDSLPSEETRVELPDGRSLSQLDLELRRRAGKAAWDDYIDNPNPETAAAAEEAWRQQATPGWLDQQRRAHQERKSELEAAVEAARSEKDSAGQDLAKARSDQQDACAESAEAKQLLDECLQQAAAKAKAEAQPAPTPPIRPQEPAPGTPPPPPVTEPSGTSEDVGDEACREGEKRWVEFDGPHPFTVPGDEELIKIGIVLIAGTRRDNRLGSLDRSEFASWNNASRTYMASFSMFEAATPADIGDAFSGRSGLAESWAPAGAGAVQSVRITISYQKRSVSAFCDRREVCVDGVWQQQNEWRSRISGAVETVESQIVVRGNIEAGLARREEDYLAEVVGFLMRVQSQVRSLLDAKRTLDDYRRNCRGGRREA